MFLLLRIVFWCAVSYVSCSISSYADGYNSTIERPLQPASGTVGFLHCSGWKSRRRPTPIGRALERALLPDGHPLSTVQASHVRLIYSLAKRIQNTKGGEDWDTWTETSPFGSQRAEVQATSKVLSNPSGTERQMKMTQILDQGDDGEFTQQGEDSRAAWYQQYLATVGGWPPEEEDPTLEQLSALQRRITTQDTAPFRGLCKI